MRFANLERDGMIIRAAPLGLIATNCYVIGCARTFEGAIIDSVAEPDTIDAMVQHTPALSIGKLLQTHAHIDHVAALSATRARYAVPIHIHAAEQPLYDAAPAQGLMLGIQIGPLPPAEVYWEEGDTVEIGELSGRIIHAPGHTPGGCCLYFEAQKVVFSGDLLFRGSIGRTDLPGGHGPTIFESLATVAALPEDTLVLSGHGPETTIGQERRTNPFLRMI